LVPLKAGLAKVTGTFTVTSFPVEVKEAVAALTVHWLLDSDCALPNVIGPWKPLPALFTSRNVFALRLNST